MTLTLIYSYNVLSIAQATFKSNACKFQIDLVHVNDDKVNVELITPVIEKKSITYHIPKIVPGTYSEDDYGRYIEQLKAFDKKGETLKVVQTDINSWAISDARKLYKLSYVVNDSYDDGTTKQVIFEPAGSNIQKDTNYVINDHCFLGYFDDMKNISYVIYSEMARSLFLPATKARFIDIINELIKQGVEGVIVGCTEIPLLVGQDDCSIPVFDTTHIHATAAVNFALLSRDLIDRVIPEYY